MPSVWDEPFGRIAMEASNYGNAVILSGKGGLLETTNHYIKLKKNNENNLFKEINNLIVNQKKLSKMQKQSFYNPKITIEKNVRLFDKIKLKTIKD